MFIKIQRRLLIIQQLGLSMNFGGVDTEDVLEQFDFDAFLQDGNEGDFSLNDPLAYGNFDGLEANTEEPSTLEEHSTSSQNSPNRSDVQSLVSQSNSIYQQSPTTAGVGTFTPNPFQESSKDFSLFGRSTKY